MKPQDYRESRRKFLKQSFVAGALLPLSYHNLSFASTHGAPASPDAPGRLKLHVFSKHLQFLNYKDMAEAAAEIGFDGVDLTVRPKGHVLPERVEDDLPKAVEAIKKAGLAALMMTTAVDDANDPVDIKVLETAVKTGISYYRMNWLRYEDSKTMPETMETLKQKLKELSLLNKKLQLNGCYQNHSGQLVGASLWELWELLKETDRSYTGVQYDIRHAVVEGGMSWKNGLRLIHPQIKMIALKDFKWGKKDGQWLDENTPIGEGMVDFTAYFKLLKKYQVQAPVSMHFEYPLEGAEHGAFKISGDRKIIFKSMKRDIQKIQELWEKA